MRSRLPGENVNPAILSKLSKLRGVSLERVTHLRAKATSTRPVGEPWISAALQELDVTHEELRVVEEELHAQSEALATAYRALEHERSRYRSLFDGAPVAYLVTDCSGIVTEANGLACKLLNIELSFILGKPIAVFVAAEDRRMMREVLGVMVSTAEITTCELRLWPRQATESANVAVTIRRSPCRGPGAATLRWILQSIRPSRDDLVAVHEIAQATKSLTSLKAMSARARSIQSWLQPILRELTKEREQRLVAEDVLARRHEQLAYVANELRHPINAACGWLELLVNEDSSAESHERVAEVLSRNLKAIARIVNDLADQASLVQKPVLLDCCETEVRALLERVCDDALGLAHAKRLSFSCEIEVGNETVFCDRHRIQQALNNVVGNAIKFTPPGGNVLLKAALRAGWLECDVRDSGRGIAAEHFQRIFEPYVQIDARGATPGLGLGLHIARKLLELHGGTLAVESKGLGFGATFRIRVPQEGPCSES